MTQQPEFTPRRGSVSSHYEAPAAGNDWRIHGQWHLLYVVLHFTTYRTRSPDWDHDHCEFCWGKFTETPCPDTLQAGYANFDNFYWVCQQCFDDFKDQFKFSLAPRIGQSPKK